MAHSRTDLRHRRNAARLDWASDPYETRKCKVKRRHSQAQAVIVAKQSESRTGQKMTAFKCRYGDHWHVGRQREFLEDGVVSIKKADSQ